MPRGVVSLWAQKDAQERLASRRSWRTPAPSIRTEHCRRARLRARRIAFTVTSVPADFVITPTDWQLIEKARKRGEL
jgi:hypothetical protein